MVVLADADLELAVQNSVLGRCSNAGQVCFSPKRFIIVKDLYDKFKEKLILRLKEYKYGNPLEESTEIGPLAREDLYSGLEKQLENIPVSWKISWQR